MSTHEDGDTALLLYEGLQNAFIGSIERYGQPPIACYSKRLVIKVLKEGYDLTDNNSAYWSAYIPELAGGACPNASLTSAPFFFDINASTQNEPEGINATGGDWEHAVYGFAVKTYNSVTQKY